MLIGFSVSKCVADILDKKVAESEVIVILGGTRFNENSFDAIVDGYTFPHGPWGKWPKSRVKSTLVSLYNKGKIHQPRQYVNGYPEQSPTGEHWMRLTPEPDNLSAAAKKAWDNYVLLAAFNEQPDEEDD